MPIAHKVYFWLCLFVLIVNIIRLVRSVRFRRAFKDKKCVRVTAEIISAYGHLRGNYNSTRYASARYDIDGKTVVGNMIGPYVEGRFRLQKGQTAEVIVNSLYPNIFAFSEKQVRRAFREHLFFVICLSLFTAIFALEFFVTYKK